MYHSVVVPLDGSGFGEHALPLGARVARRSSATAHLAHVHQPLRGRSFDPTRFYAPELEATQRGSEQAYLERQAERLQVIGVDADIVVLNPPVVPALHDYAVACNADLIVMTTHGYGGLSRVWLGSVADGLARSAPMPLLLVRPAEQAADLDAAPAVDHVLIPLDGSSLAERVITRAIALGSLFGARFTLLHVIAPVPGVDQAELYPTAFAAVARARACDGAHSYLDSVATPMRAEGLDVHTDVVRGDAALAILEYAQSQAVDVVALATRGRGGLARLVIGSVADKVMRGAPMAVLLYRP